MRMHPATEEILKHFTYDHLPEELQNISEPICTLASIYATELDGSELTAGLRKLLEAKDCMVRAAIAPSLEEAIAEGKVEWCDQCLTPGGHHRLGCVNG